jgi:hypothetical protein
MQAIEFQAVAHNRHIRLPDEIPDGMIMRVLLLVDELKESNNADTIPLNQQASSTEEKLYLLRAKLQAGENSPIVTDFNAEHFISGLHRKYAQ